ncbi:MAG: carbohydrate kinase family protein [bacterium]|nr:carbohydrate kinase family protein [bacterium]
MKQFDFIAIGDITTDAFIKLKPENAHVVCDSRGRKCQICMNFGDKVEYESVTEVFAVGNSPNAAVSARRLGLTSALVSNLGDDYYGEKKLEVLKQEDVDARFVKVHAGKKSNYHYVLWYEEERTILVKHHEYPYALPNIGKPQWIYLSSLGKNSIPFHKEIASYLQKNESVRLAFQPGTFQINLGYETLKALYKESDLFFCNVEEAKRILNTKEGDIKQLLSGVRELGPRTVVITDGPAGAYSFDGKEMLHMPMYPDPAPPVDRTGAGDSFASTFTVMLALGKTVEESLLYAPVNSMSVVQKVGAQEGLLTLSEIEAWLAKATAEYKIQKI